MKIVIDVPDEEIQKKLIETAVPHALREEAQIKYQDEIARLQGVVTTKVSNFVNSIVGWDGRERVLRATVEELIKRNKLMIEDTIRACVVEQLKTVDIEKLINDRVEITVKNALSGLFNKYK